MKRTFDILLSGLGLLFLWPVLLVVAILVKREDGSPVFFNQERVGRGGELFRIHKFRTMFRDAESCGPSVTGGGDPRITRMGRILRKTKLDELPQLLNVLRGDMSFVGPRPEVAKYVALYTDEQRAILEHRPGITDLATLRYRNEEEILAEADDPESYYIEKIIPAKIALNLEHARKSSFFADLGIILKTLLAIVSPSRTEVEKL